MYKIYIYNIKKKNTNDLEKCLKEISLPVIGLSKPFVLDKRYFIRIVAIWKDGLA